MSGRDCKPCGVSLRPDEAVGVDGFKCSYYRCPIMGRRATVVCETCRKPLGEWFSDKPGGASGDLLVPCMDQCPAKNALVAAGLGGVASVTRPTDG